MSHDTRNPFSLSGPWGQNDIIGYGPYEYDQPWLSSSKNANDFNETTGPRHTVYAQMTVVGGAGGTVPELYNFTATEDLGIGGHKFWNDNQNFTAGIDEALAVQDNGGVFVPKPKRNTLNFITNANSRVVFFALEPTS
jgi:hypothetical protein